MSDAAVRRDFVRRFDRLQRLSHGALMVSFLGTSATGMPLLFSDQRWAWWLSRLWGGFEAAGTLHRMFATVMVATFLLHVARVGRQIVVGRDYSPLWGPSSMVPQPRDAIELYQHFRWFLGRGPAPRFGRFTYWEKFDYWAVFWGMIIIGGSGLMLWFPGVATMVLPGSALNIALLVHGEEALLAVSFIFTVHFFNGHLRPEKFPMDLVIFTGRLPRDEMERERPAELEALVQSGRLDEVLVPAPSPRAVLLGRLAGTAAVTVGLTLLGLIFYAILT
jgi:cytochrome b subunit of formate dehydrogenase